MGVDPTLAVTINLAYAAVSSQPAHGLAPLPWPSNDHALITVADPHGEHAHDAYHRLLPADGWGATGVRSLTKHCLPT